MDSDSAPESKLISLICQLYSLCEDWDPESIWKFISCCIEIISLVSSMDLDSQLKQESELISLITETISIFNSMDLNSQQKPLRKLISLISQKCISLMNSVYSDLELDPYLYREFMDVLDETSSLHPRLELHFKKLSIHSKLMRLVADTMNLKPEPKLISLIHQIFSLVISKNSKLKKLTSVCRQAQVTFKEGKIHVIEEVSRRANNKWKCLPLNWYKFRLRGEEGYTHFLCEGCNGENHKEYNNAPPEIKHPLHPKHLLQLVFSSGNIGTRECYSCEKNLGGMLYCCSACDYAIEFSCANKAPVLSIDYPKWHGHTLALFPSQASLPCSICALTHSSCPLYICPPCDFVVHQRCFSLPRVIRISRHHHRISFTPSFVQGNWFCGVCRRKTNNDYGSYSCTKDGCWYVAHSKCATQSNVWDGVELEGEPEEVEEE